MACQRHSVFVPDPIDLAQQARGDIRGTAVCRKRKEFLTKAAGVDWHNVVCFCPILCRDVLGDNLFDSPRPYKRRFQFFLEFCEINQSKRKHSHG
jgi:hypothetical protein